MESGKILFDVSVKDQLEKDYYKLVAGLPSVAAMSVVGPLLNLQQHAPLQILIERRVDLSTQGW